MSKLENSTTKKSIGPKLLSALLVVAVMVYIGYQAYRAIFSELTTEMAVMHSIYESIETQGLVFRAETPVNIPADGYTYYSIENGTRVSKNSVIASVYSDAESGRIKEQIEELDRQIAGLKEIQAEGASGHVTLDIINEQVNDTVYDLLSSTDSGIFTDVDGYRFELLSLLSKKQIITGKSVDFSAKIKQLESQKAELKKNAKSAKSVVYAPVAGYFANHTDGYEGVLNTDLLPGLTPSQLQEYMDNRPGSTGGGGKIVGGYEWYMACVVPESYYNALAVGKELSIRMTFVLDESVPVTVYACNKDGNGNLAVVFRCDYMSEELSTIRQETVEIQLVQHTGLKVPKQAIFVDENQQTGVYVLSGKIVTFRKIKQLYSEAADYVVCEYQSGQDGCLRLYDDVIVGGRGLYDGKIIS